MLYVSCARRREIGLRGCEVVRPVPWRCAVGSAVAPSPFSRGIAVNHYSAAWRLYSYDKVRRMSAYRWADRACKATCEAICGRMSWLLACGLNPLILSSWSCSPCLGSALLALRSSLRGLRSLSLASSFRLDLSNLSPTQASLTARPLASMSRSWSWRRALGLVI